MGNGGGRSGVGIGGGGGVALDIKETVDLISERERKRTEVDDILAVMRDTENKYGAILEQAVVAKLGAKNGNVLGYTEMGSGIIGINNKFWDSEKMNNAYAGCVASGFHPSNGNKSGLEAVMAHEIGHYLTQVAQYNTNSSDIDSMANRVVAEALGAKSKRQAKTLAGRISGYAKQNDAECVAEAYADVYCNGRNASPESKKVVIALEKYIKR